MSSNQLQYLGWGIVGTPKGRQFSAQGIHNQLKLDNIFDLPQEFGKCLPDPKDDGMKSILYYLTYRPDHNIIGIAEYRSILEQGQTRPGSYFGSFIECHKSTFNKDTVKNILSALIELNSFHYNNFIDHDTKSYKEVISNKTIESPIEELKIISMKLNSLENSILSSAKNEKILFIIANEREQIEFSIEYILEKKLYFLYNNIYLSESNHIISQMRNKKLHAFNVDQLIAAGCFSQSYDRIIDSLKNNINNLHYENKQLGDQLTNINKEIQQKIQEGIYLEQKKLEEKLEEIEEQNKKIQVDNIALDLGKSVFNIIKESNETLNKLNLSQFSELSYQKKNEISHIYSILQKITEQSENYQRSPTTIQLKTSASTYIFTILSIILFIISIILSFTNKSPDISQNINRIEHKLKNIDTTISNNTNVIERIERSIKDSKRVEKNELERNRKK